MVIVGEIQSIQDWTYYKNIGVLLKEYMKCQNMQMTMLITVQNG
jgi:hypothetical protein